MYRTLTLEGSTPMDKAGYVKISDVYSMDWQDAEPLWGANSPKSQKAQLDAKSLKALLFATCRLAGYSPGGQYDPNLSCPTPTAPQSYASPAPYTLVDGGLLLIPLSSLVVRPGPKAAVNPKAIPYPYSEPRVSTSRSDERQPLLPIYQADHPQRHRDLQQGFCAWLWEYLKRTRLGILVRFLCCCDH